MQHNDCIFLRKMSYLRNELDDFDYSHVDQMASAGKAGRLAAPLSKLHFMAHGADNFFSLLHQSPYEKSHSGPA